MATKGNGYATLKPASASWAGNLSRQNTADLKLLDSYPAVSALLLSITLSATKKVRGVEMQLKEAPLSYSRYGRNSYYQGSAQQNRHSFTPLKHGTQPIGRVPSIVLLGVSRSIKRRATSEEMCQMILTEPF